MGVRGGKAQPVYTVTDPKYIERRAALPVEAVTNRGVLGGRAIPVYFVPEADLAENGGGWAQEAGPAIPIVLDNATRKRMPSNYAVPVYLVGASSVSPTFLLRDDFTTTESAPLASPRTAEPGPGTATITDTSSLLTISGGSIVWPQGAGGNGDPLLVYDPISPAAGRGVFGTLNIIQTDTNRYRSVGFGFSDTVYTNSFNAKSLAIVHISSGSLLTCQSPDFASFNRMPIGYNLGWVTGVANTAVVQLGSVGFAYLVKPDGGDWTLLYTTNYTTVSDLYPYINGSDYEWSVDTIRVADLGGPWATDYGIATDRLAGNVSAGTTFTHEADFVLEFTVTTLPAPSTINIKVRIQDANNYWLVQVRNDASLWLFECVDGSFTNRASAAAGIVAGHRVVIVADGSTIRGYSNNVLRWTYSSATNYQTETAGELSSIGAGAVSDIVTYPRTLSGSAAAWLNAAVAGDQTVRDYDNIPDITAAYGTRQLLSSYSGNLLRLRRVNDNAESDFGFDANGNLDTSAISTWLGGFTGYIVTWYDQSGNGHDATQASILNQPIYVASGQNGRPVASFSGANWLSTGSYIVDSDAVTLLGVVQANWTTPGSYRCAFSHAYQATLTTGIALYYTSAASQGWTAKNYLAFGSGAASTQDPRAFGLAADGTDYRILSAQLGPSLARVNANGVDASTTEEVGACNSTGNAPSFIGARNNPSQREGWSGYIAEIVFCGSALTADQVAEMEAAANAYWSVY